MYLRPLLVLLIASAAIRIVNSDEPKAAETVPHPSPIILAHYMPWYTAKPHSPQWGWHWTMNHFDPEMIRDGRREIASTYYPLIGAYDSNDPVVLEYHFLLMKVAGIDGVIIDWYGLQSFRDYAELHRNTLAAIEQIRRFGMKFAICYEDQTIPALVAAGRLQATDRVKHATEEINWMVDQWFHLENYIRLDGKPVLLSFGYAGLTNDEWRATLGKIREPVSYFSEHAPRPIATGAYDWPVPDEGITRIRKFPDVSRPWDHAIPVAIPRFVDIYKTANVGPGHRPIDDANGETFRQTLRTAIKSKAQIMQIATWNDWGEGTQIEPSREFGYRDLEYVQQTRRRLSPSTFKANGKHLRLPHRLYKLRRRGDIDAKRLDEIATAIANGRYEVADQMIRRLE